MSSKKVKKISDLQPIHFVDVVKPKLFQQWLSNPKASKIWRDVAEKMYYDLEIISRQQRVDLTKIPSQPEILGDLDPEMVGHAVMEYVNFVLDEWVDETTPYSTGLMIASLPLFVEMSKYLPHVNPKDEYQYAFRGIDMTEKVLISFIEKNNKESYWKKVKIGGVVCMSYVGPDKNKFVYKPHNPVQSWSVTTNAASSFGSQLIATQLDRSFFFEPAFMNKFGMNEDETVHFGKEQMKVALLVDVRDYKDVMDFIRNRNSPRSFSETVQTGNAVELKDDAGTLTIPL